MCFGPPEVAIPEVNQPWESPTSPCLPELSPKPSCSFCASTLAHLPGNWPFAVVNAGGGELDLMSVLPHKKAGFVSSRSGSRLLVVVL